MARRLSLPAIKGALYYYFKGRLPEGTRDLENLTVADLGLDQPALQRAPNLQADVAGLDIQLFVHALGGKIKNPAVLLRKKTLALPELAVKVHASQGAS